MVGTWLGEIRSCSCLAVLPDTAWVLLNKIYQPFFTSLYMLSGFTLHCSIENGEPYPSSIQSLPSSSSDSRGAGAGRSLSGHYRDSSADHLEDLRESLLGHERPNHCHRLRYRYRVGLFATGELLIYVMLKMLEHARPMGRKFGLGCE